MARTTSSGPPRDDGDVKRKMREDFLLLMRAQTLLPAPTKALLKFMPRPEDEAPPAHWSTSSAGSATRAPSGRRATRRGSPSGRF